VILVLLNRHAGGGRAALLEQPLREALYGHRPDLSFTAPNSVAEAQALVAAWPAGTRVIVVGGDGTLHALLPLLQARGDELALVPAGNGDDTARAFGLEGLDWRAALQLALVAPARRMDLGEVRTPHERRLFLSSLCAGFDAAVAQRALRRPAWLQGQPRYTAATLLAVAALPRWQLQADLDGRPAYQGPALFASSLNTPSYGGGMPAAPAARIDDGRLNLLLAGRFGRIGVLRMLPLLLAGRHLDHAQVRCADFALLRLRADAPLPLAADGEPMAAASEVDVLVRPGVLAAVLRR
jgi:diacylglycerol kinase (ATP)